MAERVLWWFHLAGRNAFKTVSFPFLTTVPSPQASGPDLGGGGHQHFVILHMKGILYLFLEAQFMCVIKTHISQHSVPW